MASLAFIIGSMLEWGLYNMLDIMEHRSMRLVCREMLQAVDACIDTLVLRLNNTPTHNRGAVARAAALFHRGKKAANCLHIRMPHMILQSSVQQILDTYRRHSKAAGSAQLAVKHCHISMDQACSAHLKRVLDFLKALPRLEKLTADFGVQCTCCGRDAAVHVIQ